MRRRSTAANAAHRCRLSDWTPSSGPGLIRNFLVRQKWNYVLGILAIGVAEFAQVHIPHILGTFVNQFKSSGANPSQILHDATELVMVAAGYVLCFGFGQIRIGQLSRMFEFEMRETLFTHWETLSTEYFQRHSVGDLLNHALNDVQAVRQALSMGLNQISQAIFLFAATLYMTIRTIDLPLTLVSLVPIVLIPLVIVIVGPKIRTRSRLVQEALSRMSGMAEESFQAIRLVKATSNEPVEVERFTELAHDIWTRQMQLVELNTLFQALLPLLSSMSFTIGLVYGGYLALHGQISLGAFVAFTIYLAMLVQPLLQFGYVINTFQNASASLLRIRTLLAQQPDIMDPENPIQKPWIGDLHLRHLTFRYQGTKRPVLSDVSLNVPHGTTLGIVGRTGAGKTTLLNLLLREYDPPPNTIFIDGVDIRTIPVHTLRDLIAYVPQDGFLFSTTLGQNIAFSQPQVIAEAVERAATQSRIWETIEKTPEGIETEIGERGIMLSGGQRQRTALARALMKRQAKILVLDDSLSAVDTRTESDILEARRTARGQQTTIVVAHRLSAVRDADQIIVLERGVIVESGTHQELIHQQGIYADLYHLQMGGAEHLG